MPMPTTRTTLCFLVLLFAAAKVSAQANFQILHAFGAPNDGESLWSAVTLDGKGNIYGTTSAGGLYGLGTVFRLTPDGSGGWSESILHNFPEYTGDAFGLYGSLTLDGAGDLYGPSSEGGAYTYGAVFKLAPDSVGGWSESVIYSFDPHCCVVYTAHNPYSGLVQDLEGNLFGLGGGGILYELIPGSGGWIYRTICASGPCLETGFSGLSITSNGELYGGAARAGPSHEGAVYGITDTQVGWRQYDLYNFGGYTNDGQQPANGKVAYDSKSTIYGATFQGGSNNCGNGNCGTIYKLVRQPNGQWKETVLFNFGSGATGFNPIGGVILDKAGNLYGTTGYGGGACGCGVVYRLSPNKNDSWTYTVLHTFDGFDGALPAGDLVVDVQGNLYGTTVGSGPDGGGVVFEITP